MFAKIAALAALALPLVSALTINTPTGVTTGGVMNATWEATTADPGTFSIYMVNTIFHNTFAIANNVQTSAGILTITLPQVPVADGYTLQAISITNINTVYATSGDFAVGAQTTASVSSMSSTSMTSSTGTPGTASTVAPASSAAPTTATTSSSASATPSNINSSGAASLKNGMGPAAVVLLSAVAGAAIML
ncbi:hypothetical protein DEU56DRAFT_281866 [Suillus clintonianus]|uniref:uncharacterized protein n=1 Tax=Suillus clintonianus TaxID=1904413 RepID=UPI001B86FE86|nr:uncharacterized protein DEU56DRAFT_281866 [Suillus clintonianus]KAG2141062.1 hypothetical protein DEU56DRAFT_281866 [Suillus clintonianus]